MCGQRHYVALPVLFTMKKNFKKIIPYLFISPWVFGFIVFTAGPLFYSLYMSLCEWSIFGDPKFVGFKNYIDMFTNDAQVLTSLKISCKFALIFVPLNMIIALFLAMLISQPLKGVKLFRTVYYIPTVISSVALSILFGWMLNYKYGIINYILSLVGIEGPMWLIDKTWAIIAVVLVSAFGVGTMMLIFYTDIKSIDPGLYESAALDGAGPFRQFFDITLPLITPTILFNLITSIIGSFQEVSLVMLLTGGGPMKSTYFYGLMTYNNAFKHHKFGYAAANAWAMFVIILLLTLLVFRSSSVWTFYESEVEREKPKKRKRAKV